ncbi:MAG: ACT domain-containing protein [Oscillospiraceae bacterium]|nr:ACT domain-containing protein [Oscillospiraceae bacterium]
MLIHQISVFVENRTGRLSDITGVLARNNIDIRALSIADTTDFGILRLIVNEPEKAVAALKGEGITVSKTEVVAVRLADEPGALHDILEALRERDIVVEYAYAFLTRKDADACVILRVEDNEKAVEALKTKGQTLLTGAELYGM